MTNSMRMPVVFFGHGSPTNALETNRNTETWRRIGKSVGNPKAILSVSAHWYIPGTAVTAMSVPKTIHDFGRSLPAKLFTLQYPAPGDPALARRVRNLLRPIDVRLDESWGLDHGTWSVLLKAYPEADIPVVQLSIDATKPGSWHFDVGRRLRPLRDEGVLVMGTGNVVHNLSLMDWDIDSEPYDWAARFNDRVKTCILKNEPDPLFEVEALDRDAALSVPGPDHFLPLLYVLGARHDGDRAILEPSHVQHKSLSMLSVLLDDRPTPA